MARKIEARIRSWLPFIIITTLEHEELTTLNICQQIGRRLASLPSSEAQYEEVISVLDLLVKGGFLTEKSSKKAHYWGMNFENIKYTINPSFEEFIRKTQNPPSKETNSSESVQYTVNQNNYVFNITFAIEKLVEFKTGLVNF